MARLKIAAITGAVAAALVFAAGESCAGPAINQFEVKDLESSPGDFEFQSQNAYAFGQPGRKFVDTPAGERLYDDNTVVRQREALELQLGITDWLRFRIGLEYEQERLDDPTAFSAANSFGSLKLNEVALEGVLVFVPVKKDGIGIGLLVEYGSAVNEGSEGQNELFVGPIIEVHKDAWKLIANLAFVNHQGGTAVPGNTDFVRDEKWDFAYFLQLENRLSRNWAISLEAYGTFDRIGNSGQRGEEARLFGDFNQHRAGPIAYYTFYPGSPATPASRKGSRDPVLAAAGGGEDGEAKELSVTIGAGALFGLNGNTPDTTLKLSLEVDY